MAKIIDRSEYETEARKLAYQIMKQKRKIERNDEKLKAFTNLDWDDPFFRSVIFSCLDDIVLENLIGLDGVLGDNQQKYEARMKEYRRAKRHKASEPDELRNIYENVIIPECDEQRKKLAVMEEQFTKFHMDFYGRQPSENPNISDNNKIGKDVSLQPQEPPIPTFDDESKLRYDWGIDFIKDDDIPYISGDELSGGIDIFDNTMMTNESIKNIEKARRFKKLVNERKERYDKISVIKSYRLTENKYEKRGDGKKLEQLQKEQNLKDKEFRDFVHAFSINPDYKVTPELAELIGMREEERDIRDKKFGTLTRPTIKQHLEPIEKIDDELYLLENMEKFQKMLKWKPEELALHLKTSLGLREKRIFDNLNDEEKNKLKEPITDEKKKEIEEKKKKLKAEKEKREKRLGKKWILKLKIDRLNAEIKSLMNKLKAFPNDKNILNELESKRAELAKLENEYGEILKQIGEMIADTIEKDECEKHGVKDFEELKTKLKDKIISNQPQSPITPKKDQEPASPLHVEEPENIPISVPKVNQEGVRGLARNTPTSYISNTPIASTSPTVLPAVETKKHWWNKVKDNLTKRAGKKEEEKCETERKYEVAGKREKIEDDEIYQLSNFPLPRILNGYFYHTIKENGELVYVKEKIDQINCTKKDVIGKIKEIQEDWSKRSMNEVTPEDKKAVEIFLSSSPKKIYREYIKHSLGKEAKMKREELMCGMLAANSPLEAVHATFWGLPRDVESYKPRKVGVGENILPKNKKTVRSHDEELLNPEMEMPSGDVSQDSRTQQEPIKKEKEIANRSVSQKASDMRKKSVNPEEPTRRETSYGEIPTEDDLRKLANYFGMTIEEFLHGGMDRIISEYGKKYSEEISAILGEADFSSSENRRRERTYIPKATEKTRKRIGERLETSSENISKAGAARRARSAGGSKNLPGKSSKVVDIRSVRNKDSSTNGSKQSRQAGVKER